MLKKKIWPNFPRIIEVFNQKIVTKPSKIRDPRSGIRDPEKTYSGSRIQGSKRHLIPDPDPQHCYALIWLSWMIRIRIGNADPDTGARKPTKM
jgi:hypothetical protein